ncbi:ABC transporter ATP-binding protein [Pigmentiphaga sp. NML080357]|uniref:ABC transporter ATP-binding protein n=1 Tax=Pigmentiphaga sp. NML080357 TaxID=2008675 RepID=UPI000B4153E8|nr:ABC transporter ATP-binding protein [Pigmentiphaga sp. NML080357]OVZ55077.1 ABC transporter ATP-binding protein [Pigmentiphaga sp. NML080357]
MSALLRVSGLRAAYRSHAVLHDVSLEIPMGGVTTLLGANGAGKTTLLRAISGAMVTFKGSIELEGRRIDGMSTDAIARLGVAHVPDGRGTFPALTVEENLMVGAISRRDRTGVREDMGRMYELFPKLSGYRRSMAGLLSGGEQQMLAIARALMLRPRLLMLDEPSFGLAPLVVKQIFDMLREIKQEARLGILLVEQNARLALEIADSACVLEVGRVAIAGDANSLRGDPRVRAAYLGLQQEST